MRGYEHANGIALDLWEEVYPDSVLVALTDTFSTKAFFQVRQSFEKQCLQLGSVSRVMNRTFLAMQNAPAGGVYCDKTLVTRSPLLRRLRRSTSGSALTIERTTISSVSPYLDKTLALQKH